MTIPPHPKMIPCPRCGSNPVWCSCQLAILDKIRREIDALNKITAAEPLDPFVLDEANLNSYDEQEFETMARLTSELQDAGVATTIPNGIYNGHVVEVRDEDKNDVSKPLTSQAGAPMVQLDWEIDEGDYTGRKIRYDTIMLGGVSREGKPISLSNLCNFLHRTGVAWSCLDCKNPEIGRKFYIAEGNEDDKSKSLKKGNFYCPDCKSTSPRITYETKTFMGARCGIGVGTKPGTDGREFNIIKGYTDPK